MEKNRRSPVFEINPNQRRDLRIMYGYQDENQFTDAIDRFDAWIRKQNHFFIKDYDKNYLEGYLIGNKGSVERAKKHFDKICTFRNLMPEFLQNYDLKREFLPLFKCAYCCTLPKPTPDNYRLTIASVHDNQNHLEAKFLDFYRYLVVVLEYLYYFDYNAGFITVLDARNLNFPMLAKASPIVIHKALTMFIEAYGLRIKQVHIILPKSKLSDALIALVKTAVSGKIKERFFFHTAMETLFEHVPMELFPKDYGGKLDTLKEISDRLFKEVSSDEHIARMKFLQSCTTNEKMRLSCAFNEEYSGLPGSFKTLCVD